MVDVLDVVIEHFQELVHVLDGKPIRNQEKFKLFDLFCGPLIVVQFGIYIAIGLTRFMIVILNQRHY